MAHSKARSRYDLEDDELGALVAGEPSYRFTQLREGLYRELREPSEITNLPGRLRERLQAAPELAPALEVVTERTADQASTIKWLYALADGAEVETVLMYYRDRSTVCVSSQAGCAMACSFCATGQGGYLRHLTTGEIVEQVVRAERRARAASRRVDHVVYMGMGEPFANFDRVWRSVERVVGDLGLAARHVTLSTVGIVPKIIELSRKPLQVNLAVSLHAARDELRDQLVPINRRYPIEVLVRALERYLEHTRRRVSFEWALIDSVNDTDRDARELAEVARKVHAHVNLIPLNPISPPGSAALRGTPGARVAAFADLVAAAGVPVTVRKTRGRSIDAACGQLAARSLSRALEKTSS